MYNFQVEDYHTYYVGELALWVHNADKKYGNGHYENNPSDNPKVLADAQEDPNAVYGYRPSKYGSLKDFANGDWSDPKFVENARQRTTARSTLSNFFMFLPQYLIRGLVR